MAVLFVNMYAGRGLLRVLKKKNYKMDTKSVSIVGIGGQGIIMASEIVACALMLAGFDVKKNEIKGMSQMGGSVSSCLRFGQKVYSPLPQNGQTDILLSFELIEACRSIDCLRADAPAIINNFKLNPMGSSNCELDLIGQLRQSGRNIILVDGIKLALEAGNIKAVNVALLGVLANYLSLEKDVWLQAVAQLAPKKTYKINEKAFMLGYQNDSCV